jgi:flagellar basal body-associated protein FliL
MGKRNRIVIDFNHPAPRAITKRAADKQSRGTRRVLALIGIIIGIVLLGAIAGGYFWWQHFKAQPAYTVALLVDAAQRNDNQELERILDYDKISESFVSDVRSRVTGSSSILNGLTPTQLDQTVANITPRLKETLREVLPREIQRVSEPAKGRPFIFIALGVSYFANVRQAGTGATVDLKFKDEQIQLTMQQAADAWRIVSIKDDRVTNIIADTAKKGLSQRGSQLQDQIIRSLKNLQAPSPSP